MILPALPAIHAVVPSEFWVWSEGQWVEERLAEAGVDSTTVLGRDVNEPLTALGSVLLHLAAMSPTDPSKKVVLEVLRFLLEDLRADPNAQDLYGRTALSLFISAGSQGWFGDDGFGTRVLNLLFAYGARTDLPFAPRWPHVAGKNRWLLEEHLNDQHHGKPALPEGMRAALLSRGVVVRP